MRNNRLICVLLFGLAVAAGSVDAAAEGARVTYSPGPSCPPAEELLSRVATHTPRALEQPLAGAPSFHVRIEPSDGGSLAVLTTRAADGTESTRALPGASCEEVVSAAALVIALVLDPEALSDASERPASNDAAATPNTASPPSPVAPMAPPDAPREDAPPQHPVRVSGEAYHWAIGAQALLGWAIAPVASLGGGLIVELSAPRDGLPWVLRGSGFYITSPDISTADGTADLSLAAGHVTGCLRFSGAVGPCAGVELGELRGLGRDTDAPTEAAVLWAAATATVLTHLDLGRAAYAEAEGGAVLPFIRDRFYLDPHDSTVHEVPPAAAIFKLGVGVQIP